MRLSFPVLSAILVMIGASAYCGKSSGRRESDSISVSQLIPDGWDGATDWSGTTWRVEESLALHKDPSTRPSATLPPIMCSPSVSEAPKTFKVRVRFYQGGSVHQRLLGHKGLREFDLNSSPKISTAVLELNSLALLEELAAQTHSHAPGGCVAIELLNEPGSAPCQYGLSRKGNGAVVPPAYDETVNLSSVASILAKVSQNNISAHMTTLQNMGTRYFNANNAATVSNQVLNLFQTAGSNFGAGFSVNRVNHTGIASTQPSVIASLEGTGSGPETIVIGAHLDSINPGDQTNAPGADDNASGIAVLAEVIRLAAAEGLQFSRKIEWHAYAAEEVGLIGSQQIAGQYAASGRKVTAMMQLDMTSYGPSDDTTIHLFRDDTTTILRRSVKDLLTNYLGGNFSDEPISVAGTSDHRSWANAGYPTVFPFENMQSYNPVIHSAADTVANANLPGLARRMAQLVMAFLAHHGGLTRASTEYASEFAALQRNPDIKLAVLSRDEVNAVSVQRQMNEDDTVVIFAAPDTVSEVESCSTAAGFEKQCGYDRHIGTAIADGPEGRRFFYAIIPATEHESLARTFGYNENNAPTHARAIYISRN